MWYYVFFNLSFEINQIVQLLHDVFVSLDLPLSLIPYVVIPNRTGDDQAVGGILQVSKWVYDSTLISPRHNISRYHENLRLISLTRHHPYARTLRLLRM